MARRSVAAPAREAKFTFNRYVPFPSRAGRASAITLLPAAARSACEYTDLPRSESVNLPLAARFELSRRMIFLGLPVLTVTPASFAARVTDG